MDRFKHRAVAMAARVTEFRRLFDDNLANFRDVDGDFTDDDDAVEVAGTGVAEDPNNLDTHGSAMTANLGVNMAGSRHDEEEERFTATSDRTSDSEDENQQGQDDGNKRKARRHSLCLTPRQWVRGTSSSPAKKTRREESDLDVTKTLQNMNSKTTTASSDDNDAPRADGGKVLGKAEMATQSKIIDSEAENEDDILGASFKHKKDCRQDSVRTMGNSNMKTLSKTSSRTATKAMDLPPRTTMRLRFSPGMVKLLGGRKEGQLLAGEFDRDFPRGCPWKRLLIVARAVMFQNDQDSWENWLQVRDFLLEKAGSIVGEQPLPADAIKTITNFNLKLVSKCKQTQHWQYELSFRVSTAFVANHFGISKKEAFARIVDAGGVLD